MKIDLHVHTKERSSCGQSSEEEQICAAMRAGLDALALTDHDRLIPLTRLQALNEMFAPLRIFGGIEMSIRDPQTLGFEHLLVLGVHDERLESGRWTYPNLHRFVREHNGFMALAHPFRFNAEMRLDLEQFPPDALEAYSNNIPKQAESRLLTFARELGVPVLSNSDAHQTSKLGRHYNLLPQSPANDRQLIELLKAGQYTCVSP